MQCDKWFENLFKLRKREILLLRKETNIISQFAQRSIYILNEPMTRERG